MNLTPKPPLGSDNSSKMEQSLMDTLMSEALQMSSPQTSVDTPNATSLPESEGGVLPCNSQDGLQACPCGLEAVPVNPSQKEANLSDITTQETCGTQCTASYPPSDLSLFLGSRLKERLSLDGSTDYKQTWRKITTPAGVLLWGHTARLYPTLDNDFSGLPTPAVNSILERNCPKKDGRVRFLPSGRVRKSSKKGKEGSMNWSQDVLLRGYLPTPKLCLFLMGYPEEWWESVALAMQSFPKSRRSSSKPQSKQ